MAKKKKSKPARSAKRHASRHKRAAAPKTPPKLKDDLTLDEIDQKIRINELKFKLEEVAGREVPMTVSEDCPPEIQEEFLKNVIAYETAEMTTDFKRLRKDGVVLPPADQLSDEEVSAKLKELIERLARRHTYVTSTDHLSDRELYEHLWTDSLREEHPDIPGDCNGGWCIDLVSSGSEEDTEIWLKYYASDADRKRWKKEWPKHKIPKKEKKPYDRDRFLPKLEFRPEE